MDNNDANNGNQNETSDVERQEQENLNSNKKMAQTGLKGAATVAGAYLGGTTGAKIGAKAADVINNTPVGNAITDAAAQAGNIANKMSPTGKTNQALTNAAVNSGAVDLADKGIDAAANSGLGNNNQPNSEIPGAKILPNQPVSTENNNLAQNSNNSQTQKQRAPISGKNQGTSHQKNPSRNKYSTLSKNHSKHADGSNDDLSNTDDNNNLAKKKRPLSDEKKKSDEQSSNDESNSKKEEKQFGTVMKMLGTFMSGIFGALGAIGMFIITHLVLISIVLVIAAVVILISAIITLIVSFFQYAKEEDGTVCYVTPSCNKIVIKDENGDKNYSLDEYIAGAIVNYYDHDTYALPGTNVSQNLLQAFSVIIHSDIAAYSDYDIKTETCTVSKNSQFSNIYVPTETQDDNGIDKSDDVSNEDVGENTQDTDANNTEDSVEQQKLNYYNQAKLAANTVLSNVVDIYTQRINIFYDGYTNILNTSSSINNDYKSIIRDYLKNSPDYESVISEENNDKDDSETADDDDPVGIYPVCDFDKSNSENNIISYSNDICSTVHINSGSNAGDYTIDKFIEGVVYNEAGGWSNSLDTLKAHAVAARTYLVNRGRVENGTCYIDTGTNTMGYTNKTNDAVTQAVTETSGEYIMVNGQISKEAEWDALCITNPNTTGSNYTICQKNQQISKKWIDEDVTLYGTISWYNKHSHGRGMSQYGAYYMATVQNKSYKDIIKYYYDADVGTVITQSKEGFVMPINTFSMITGETTGYCGSGKEHSGMDFAAPVGTPIYAAHDGVIVKTYDYSSNCYGSCSSTQGVGIGFRIDNQDGTVSMYMHMNQRMNLGRGTTVKAGQLLGYVGNTGSSTGPHLHYGMLSASTGAVLNPRNYLPLDEKGIGKCHNYK